MTLSAATVNKPPRDAAAYGHWAHDHVRYADLDAVGHANNNAIGVFFEAARVVLLRDMGVAQVGGATLCVLATLNMEFLQEMTIFEQIRIGQKVARIGNSSFTLHSACFVEREGKTVCTATCEAVCVLVDGATHRPTPIPAQARAVLEQYG